MSNSNFERNFFSNLQILNYGLNGVLPKITWSREEWVDRLGTSLPGWWKVDFDGGGHYSPRSLWYC